MKNDVVELFLEMMSYFYSAVISIKPLIVFIGSGVSYLLFPTAAFVTYNIVLLIAMVLDIITKYYALSIKNGGFRLAFRNRHISSNKFWIGTTFFESPLPPIREMKYLEIKNSIVDEIYIREKTDYTVNTTSTKDDWVIDTVFHAQFNGNLEAGNINNNGIPIESFAVKRRKVNETAKLLIARLPFSNNDQLIYDDYLQANDEYIYSVTPVGVNGLEGYPTETKIKSEFTGWYLIDKNNLNNIVAFDSFLGDSAQNYNLQLNQGRTEIKTFGKFPTVFYDNSNYHSFSLEGFFYGTEEESSIRMYERILDMVNNHEPMLVKGSDGTLVIADVSNPRKNTLQNSWSGNDYFTLQLDVVEVLDEEDYVQVD